MLMMRSPAARRGAALRRSRIARPPARAPTAGRKAACSGAGAAPRWRARSDGFYAVKRGDTLYSIALDHGAGLPRGGAVELARRSDQAERRPGAARASRRRSPAVVVGAGPGWQSGKSNHGRSSGRSLVLRDRSLSLPRHRRCRRKPDARRASAELHLAGEGQGARRLRRAAAARASTSTAGAATR